MINSGYKREVSCFVAPKHGILSITTNDSSGGVEFDFFSIWERRQIFEKDDTVVMVHTHPPCFYRMSSIDKNMVHGWVKALGKKIAFIVVTEDENSETVATLYMCENDPNNKGKILISEKNFIIDRDYDSLFITMYEFSKELYEVDKMHTFLNKCFSFGNIQIV